MPSFGNEASLKFSFEVEQDYSIENWMYGHFGMSLCGKTLTNWQRIVLLSDILSLSKGMGPLRNPPRSDDLFQKTDLDLFLSFEHTQYSLDHVAALVPEHYVPTEVACIDRYDWSTTPGLEDCKMYILSTPHAVRIIYNFNNQYPIGCIVPASEYSSTTSAFLSELERSLQALEGKTHA